MSKIIKKCAACGKERELEEKPAAKNRRDELSIYFHCKSCGAANLRNGTARPGQLKKGVIDEPAQKGNGVKDPKKEQQPAAQDQPAGSADDEPGFGFF